MNIKFLVVFIVCYLSVSESASYDSNRLLSDEEYVRLLDDVGDFLEDMHSKSDRHDKIYNLFQHAIEEEDVNSRRSIDNSCLLDLRIWMNDMKNGSLYALQMRDSWSTRQGGMLEGNVRWTGHYWECVNAISDDQNIKGKFCTTYYGFTYVPIAAGFSYDITFDTCFPNSCSDEMIQILTAKATASDIRVPVLETKCREANDDKPPYNGFDISIIIISGILLILGCVGTITDILIRRSNAQVIQIQDKWLVCFSVLKNGEMILSTKQSPNNIAAINGIRTISTFWVILGHSVAFSSSYIDNFATTCQQLRGRFEYMVVLNGTFSVDSFFCIAGLLTSYLTLKHLKKTKGKINVPMMYLHRYLRLTPMCAYFLIFTTGLFKFFGSGPFWNYDISEICYNDWWTVLLYINNLYPVSNACFGHTWYLACDMQFYFLAPLFIYALYKWPRIGIIKVLSVLFTSIGITWWLSQSSNQQPQATIQGIFCTIVSRLIPMNSNATYETTYQDRFKTDLYITPWCRIGVYLIGILAGYLLYTKERKIKMSKIVVFLGWLTAVGTGMGIVYGLFAATKEPRKVDVAVGALYNAVSRPLWGACVAWVIIACTCGYGGPVTKFLNWSFFLPLSRLTYAAYLIHSYIITWNVLSQERYYHYSAVWLTYFFIGNVVISFIVAFLGALLVEWPCQEIIRLLLPSKRKADTPKILKDQSKVIEEHPPNYTSDEQIKLDETNKRCENETDTKTTSGATVEFGRHNMAFTASTNL